MQQRGVRPQLGRHGDRLPVVSGVADNVEPGAVEHGGKVGPRGGGVVVRDQ